MSNMCNHAAAITTRGTSQQQIAHTVGQRWAEYQTLSAGHSQTPFGKDLEVRLQQYAQFGAETGAVRLHVISGRPPEF